MADFHAKKLEAVLEELKTDDGGLSVDEAMSRQTLYGPNVLPDKKKVSRIVLFIRQFHSWFIYILLIAAIISFYFEKSLDSYVILAIVVINATIGYVQEYRAERAIEALRSLIVPKAKALRNGIVDALPAAELVPGDIILLEAGDRVPADARIIAGQDFKTEEASLTGESFSVEKKAGILPTATLLADQVNMVWMGTLVVSGTATAVVTATGLQTALGEIAASLKTEEHRKTHFREKTDHLAFQLGVVAIIAAGIAFALGYVVRQLPIIDVLMFSVATLVSGIPEGLPAVLAVVLAIGAYRMAQRKAIVRHLPVIEDLSVASVILTDKTGTLTQNTMTVRQIVCTDRVIEVSGEGWDPHGSFFVGNDLVSASEDLVLNKFLHIAALCNNAHIHKEGAGYEIVGDPTEAAMVVVAEKAGFIKEQVAERCHIIDQRPFAQATRMQSVLVEKPELELFITGAEEGIVKAATSYLSAEGVKPLTDKQRQEIREAYHRMTSQAMRVIATAYRRVAKNTTQVSEGDYVDLVFVGFAGILDPIRPEAPQAITEARRAGIKVLMATGDHADTAVAIGKQIGILSADADETSVLTAAQLQDLSKRDFKKAIRSASVFARMTPDMKLRVIQAWQEDKKVVAMIGDGVNDAPALKMANVGIAMGTIGTDVAREAADIILSNDNFATLVKAIEQGRVIFNNIRKTSFFMITTSAAELVTLLTSLAFGKVLPLTALQILWINLITDSIPNLALAAEQQHSDVMSRPPRHPSEKILSREVVPYLIIVVVVMTAVTLGVYFAYAPYNLTKARTMAFALMVFLQLLNAFNLRSLKESIFTIGPFSNGYVTLAVMISGAIQIMAMYIPVTQRALGITTLTAFELGLVLLLSLSIVLAVEIYKWLRRIRRTNHKKNTMKEVPAKA